MLFRSNWFSLNFGIAFVATFFCLILVQNTTGLEGGVAVQIILPLIIASMIEGQAFVKRYHSRPEPNLCWIASLRMTAIVVVMASSLFIVQLFAQPQKLIELSAIDPNGRAVAFLLMVAAAWAVLRIGYAIGLATELKGQQFSDD